MSFSFEDFLLYTKAPEADIKMFSAIAPGVLTYIQDVYGIYLEVKDISYNYFMTSTGSTFELPISPINSITSITYDGLAQVFTFYGNDIVLSTSISDSRKPIQLSLNVGYTEVPSDLKLAIYQHIESLYFKALNSSDNIEKVVNTAGNTTFFREDAIPKSAIITYNRYSNRTIALY